MKKILLMLIATAMLCMPCSAESVISPVIGDSLHNSDIVSSALDSVVPLPEPIFYYDPSRSWVSAKASGLIGTTFERTSSKTYIGSDGLLHTAPANTPTVENNVLGLQGGVENLITYSTPDATNWSRAYITIESDTLPYGDISLAHVTADNSNYYLRPPAITVTAETEYTFSFYVKNNGSPDLFYWLVDATTSTEIITVTSYLSELSENNVTRVSVTFTTPTGCTSVRVYPAYHGTESVLDAYIGGAQLETGSVATAYTPTNGAPETTTTEASNTSGRGLQVPMTQAMVDCFQGELIDWSESFTYESDPSDLEMVEDLDARTLTSPGGTFSYITASKSHILDIGETYELSLTVSDRTQGSIRCQFTSGFVGDLYSSNGTVTYRGVPTTGDGNLQIQMFGSFDGTITVNYCRHVLDDGTVNPGAGTLIQWVYLPWGSADIPVSSKICLISTKNSFSHIYIETTTANELRSVLYDGTTYRGYTVGASLQGLYAFLFQWSADESQMRCGVYDPSTDSITWSSWATYRGYFPIYDNMLRYYYAGTYPLSLGSTMLYNTANLTDQQIKTICERTKP